MRRVVLVCGPPGSGKSTWARKSGLQVFDLDDAKWQYDVAAFNAALRSVGGRADAQAAVIRSGATVSARASAAALVRATETVLLPVPLDECVRRIRSRGRRHPPLMQQIAGAKSWWDKYEPAEAFQLRQAGPSREW